MDLSRPIVTMDDDFLRLANAAWEQGIEFVGIVYISDAQISVRRAIAELQLVAAATSLTELSSRVVYVPI